MINIYDAFYFQHRWLPVVAITILHSTYSSAHQAIVIYLFVAWDSSTQLHLSFVFNLFLSFYLFTGNNCLLISVRSEHFSSIQLSEVGVCFWLHTQPTSDGLGKQLWSVLLSGFSREVKLKLLSFHFTLLFNFSSILTHFSFHSLYTSFICSIYVFKITFYIFTYPLNYALIHTFLNWQHLFNSFCFPHFISYNYVSMFFFQDQLLNPFFLYIYFLFCGIKLIFFLKIYFSSFSVHSIHICFKKNSFIGISYLSVSSILSAASTSQWYLS